MVSETRTDIVPSSNLTADDIKPANVLYESQLISPSPSINLKSINSEVQTKDTINFGNEVFIMTQQASGEPVLYEATKEFKSHYLRSQSGSETVEQKKVTYLIGSGNDNQELWKNKRILIRILIGLVCLTIVSGIVAACTVGFHGDAESFYVDRVSWCARARTCAIPDLKPRIKLVIMTHTGGVSCNGHLNCINKVRDEQANGIHAGFCDIPHAFLIGGDDRIYEGRGFRQRTNAPDKYFDKAVLIGFIGDYNVDIPSTKQFDHLRTLLDRSLSKEDLSADYKITGSIYALGSKIRTEMATWDRWTDYPDNVTSLN